MEIRLPAGRNRRTNFSVVIGFYLLTYLLIYLLVRLINYNRLFGLNPSINQFLIETATALVASCYISDENFTVSSLAPRLSHSHTEDGKCETDGDLRAKLFSLF